MPTKKKKTEVKKGAKAKKPREKNSAASRKKPAALKADAKTRAKAKKRRAELYDLWARGVNPKAVHDRTGYAVSTIKDDFAKFARDAADNASVEEKRARVEGWLSKCVEQADDTYQEAEETDARGRAAAINSKLKAVELYAKINGLMVDKVEHSGAVEVQDPRLAGFTDDQLKNAITALSALAVGSGGKARSG